MTGLTAHAPHDLGIDADLVVLGRDGAVLEEQVLGAQQADALGAARQGLLHLDRQLDVHHHLHAAAVGRDGRKVAQVGQLLVDHDLLPREHADALARLLVRVDQDLPLGAVDDDDLAHGQGSRGPRAVPRPPARPGNGQGWPHGWCCRLHPSRSRGRCGGRGRRCPKA
jgi:hypothetical protein